MAKPSAKQQERIFALMAKYQVGVPVELANSPHFAALRLPFAEKVAIVLAALDRERSEIALREAVRQLHEEFRRNADSCPTELRLSGTRLKLACTTGCNHCCHYRVTVKAPEALLLAHYLRKRLSSVELEQLSVRLAEFDAEVAQLDVLGQGYRSFLCPLNVDTLCSVYPNRPLNCAACHSFSLDACLADASHPGTAIPSDPDRRMLQALHGQALEAALLALGLASADLEFVPALRIALADPDATAKYLAGEPVFAPADRADLREALDVEFARRRLDSDQPAV